MTISFTISLAWVRPWIRAQLVAWGLWLAGKGGWQLPPPPPCALPPAEQVRVATDVCRDIDRRHRDGSGVGRRREAERVLMNLYPGMDASDRNFLLEIGHRCSRSA